MEHVLGWVGPNPTTQPNHSRSCTLSPHTAVIIVRAMRAAASRKLSPRTPPTLPTLIYEAKQSSAGQDRDKNKCTGHGGRQPDPYHKEMEPPTDIGLCIRRPLRLCPTHPVTSRTENNRHSLLRVSGLVSLRRPYLDFGLFRHSSDRLI